MIIAKRLELSGGKCFIKFTKPEWDWHISKKYKIIRYKLTHLSRESLANFFHKIAKISELILIKAGSRIERKFSKMSDMIRGKRMVKNSGSVSFFLKNIKDHKNNL